MNKIIEKIKKLWSRPAVKTVVMGAMGATGGVGAVYFQTGMLVINKVTVTASLVGAGTTIWGLFIQHPTKPNQDTTAEQVK
jgi:hypothetical protein